jgi:hypothetical protein
VRLTPLLRVSILQQRCGPRETPTCLHAYGYCARGTFAPIALAIWKVSMAAT